MCIRDRLIGGEVPDHDVLAAFMELVTGSKRRFNVPPDPETVSYTHLRAHETVLDLVCRLLLEKKKNKETLLHIQNIRQI